MPRKTRIPRFDAEVPVGFNEAAARCHGKRGWPRSFRRAAPCFNEAAARCHGKLMQYAMRYRAPCLLQ